MSSELSVKELKKQALKLIVNKTLDEASFILYNYLSQHVTLPVLDLRQFNGITFETELITHKPVDKDKLSYYHLEQGVALENIILEQLLVRDKTLMRLLDDISHLYSVAIPHTTMFDYLNRLVAKNWITKYRVKRNVVGSPLTFYRLNL